MATKKPTEKNPSLWEAIVLLSKLEKIKGYRGVKFNYAICKNIDLLTQVTKAAKKEAERVAAIKDRKLFDKENEDYKKLVSGPSEFVPHMIQAADVPAADLLTEDMLAIYPLVIGELK